jgi:hypothetical protein
MHGAKQNDFAIAHLAAPGTRISAGEAADCRFIHELPRACGFYAIFRPTAGAIIRNSFISWANCSGKSDCAPSDKALSGL